MQRDVDSTGESGVYMAKEAIIEYLERLVQRDVDSTGESGVYMAKEAIIEYLDRLLQSDLDETGKSGVYMAKEAIIEYLDRLVQSNLDETGESGVYVAKEAISTWTDWCRATWITQVSQGYTWPEAIIEYLDRLVQRDLDNTGESGVYMARGHHRIPGQTSAEGPG